MKPSFANVDETISTNTGDNLISRKKEVAAMKNTRLSISDSQLKWEKIFKLILRIMSAILLILVIGILITLIIQSMPSIKTLGVGYLWSKVWDPVQNIYGAY